MSKNINYYVESEYNKLGIKDRLELISITKTAFSKYLKNNKRTFSLYKDLLCMEYIKYKKIEYNKKYFLFFENIMLNYKKSKKFTDQAFRDLMISVFDIDAEAGNDFLTMTLNQSEILFKSKYDDLYVLMKIMGELLEQCVYKNLRLLYSLISYNSNISAASDLFTIDFGHLVSSISLMQGDTLLKDAKYSIPLNQWRNICEHKSYKFINNEWIQIEYGSKKIHKKKIKYEDILPILQDFLLFNLTIKLIFNLIYLDIMPDIQLSLRSYNIRLEDSFASLFFNLRTINFSIDSYQFNKKVNSYELNFNDVDKNESIQNRIILISQIFPIVAHYIYDDKILNITPKKIEIFLNKNGQNIASTCVFFQKALDYACNKIERFEYIKDVSYKINLDDKFFN